jgi:hypothetical protein
MTEAAKEVRIVKEQKDSDLGSMPNGGKRLPTTPDPVFVRLRFSTCIGTHFPRPQFRAIFVEHALFCSVFRVPKPCQTSAISMPKPCPLSATWHSTRRPRCPNRERKGAVNVNTAPGCPSRDRKERNALTPLRDVRAATVSERNALAPLPYGRGSDSARLPRMLVGRANGARPRTAPRCAVPASHASTMCARLARPQGGFLRTF